MGGWGGGHRSRKGTAGSCSVHTAAGPHVHTGPAPSPSHASLPHPVDETDGLAHVLLGLELDVEGHGLVAGHDADVALADLQDWGRSFRQICAPAPRPVRVHPTPARTPTCWLARSIATSLCFVNAGQLPRMAAGFPTGRGPPCGARTGELSSAWARAARWGAARQIGGVVCSRCARSGARPHARPMLKALPAAADSLARPQPAHRRAGGHLHRPPRRPRTRCAGWAGPPSPPAVGKLDLRERSPGAAKG